MSKRFLALFFITIIVLIRPGVLPIRAQEQFKIRALAVDIWPEYDRPDILFIYRIILPPGVSLPVNMTFRIPVAAGDPSAVAVRQANADGEKSLFSIPYKRQVSGEWSLVTLTATTPEIQLEYYDPGLVREGVTRRFEYRWPGDYAVDSLTIQVQQPLGASKMRISPTSDGSSVDPDGLMYYNKQVGSLTSGETFRLSIDYQKETDELTAANLQVKPSAPLASPERGQKSSKAALPWILGGLVVILIAVVWVSFQRSGKSDERAQPRNQPQSASRKELDVTEGHIYCHQCGKRAASEDRFCVACGTRLSAA